jgi:hypothetical protein
LEKLTYRETKQRQYFIVVKIERRFIMLKVGEKKLLGEMGFFNSAVAKVAKLEELFYSSSKSAAVGAGPARIMPNRKVEAAFNAEWMKPKQVAKQSNYRTVYAEAW